VVSSALPADRGVRRLVRSATDSSGGAGAKDRRVAQFSLSPPPAKAGGEEGVTRLRN
jgi:hypothetical protein